jgi:hypothetical protein
MNQNLGDLDMAEMPLHKDVASAAEASPTNVPAPGELAHWDQCAIASLRICAKRDQGRVSLFLSAHKWVCPLFGFWLAESNFPCPARFARTTNR